MKFTNLFLKSFLPIYAVIYLILPSFGTTGIDTAFKLFFVGTVSLSLAFFTGFFASCFIKE